MADSARQFNSDEITVALVRRLVAAQFPQWAEFPLTPAEPQGWDNRTFRLGATMSVRLPSAEGYTPQIEKEHRWLPYLAPQLPLPTPAPLARGAPAKGYPWNWSVYRWLDGEAAKIERIDDLSVFAAALAQFLRALQQIDPAGGPPPGPHSFFRGAPPEVYDAETRRAILTLDDEVDPTAATAVWEAGLAAPFRGPPVWFHGDVAVNNLLVADGTLSAVIDFGCCGVGDPACDLAIAWTLFSGESRDVFRTTLQVDDGTWARGRGWALWKALITLAEYRATNPLKATEARRVIGEVLAEYEASGA
jgi:aminoglycoside phosphotransferase (APT) family kinase protein